MGGGRAAAECSWESGDAKADSDVHMYRQRPTRRINQLDMHFGR